MLHLENYQSFLFITLSNFKNTFKLIATHFPVSSTAELGTTATISPSSSLTEFHIEDTPFPLKTLTELHKLVTYSPTSTTSTIG